MYSQRFFILVYLANYFRNVLDRVFIGNFQVERVPITCKTFLSTGSAAWGSDYIVIEHGIAILPPPDEMVNVKTI